MSNRLDNAKNKLKTDKELSKGEWDEMARNDEMCFIKWKDNKTVTLLSTCIGSEPLSTCKRWSKNIKMKIDVPQPGIVKAYTHRWEGLISVTDIYKTILQFLMEYRMLVASALCRYEGNLTTNRGRLKLPSIKDVRLDGVNHLPRFMDDKNASKCRMPGCTSRTRVFCTKCKMYLCVLKNNCFETFHTK
ncbi:uncharacterized protein LOC118182658 [Stegodyphus dumicola]|uniref:uncharacterized protein LOC118182658 n=1 Tax=Stegodyphus dumicola TaxID=202533 RepID=UPI0015AD6687|nr:uncharacterized protein LOC118182658 [Stegodyphus dumicola]